MKDEKNTSPNYKVGMIVEHPNRPEWGPGKVVAVSGDRLHVHFRDALERKAKVMVRAVVCLNVAGEQSDSVLDRLPPVKLDGTDWLLPVNYERLLKRSAPPAVPV